MAPTPANIRTATATIHTTAGDIVVDLFGNHAPRTVANFIGLSTGEREWTDPGTGAPGEGSLYAGTIFHRIIPQFMIQGGDPLGQGTGGPGYTFDDEIHPELSFDEPYLLAMANAGKQRDRITGELHGTNGSQFFISTVPTPWLNGNHTIFGKVTDPASQRIVDAIEETPTGPGDRPTTPVTITRIDIHA